MPVLKFMKPKPKGMEETIALVPSNVGDEVTGIDPEGQMADENILRPKTYDPKTPPTQKI